MNTATIISRVQPNSFSDFFEKVFVWIEQFRITIHLRIVEWELRHKNVVYLSLELRQERLKNLDRLHEYWVKGMYPRNFDFLDRRIPYFKDHAGTPCAMAYLIEQSGYQDLVDVTAQSNNHVYINDIHDGPVLEWINTSGLTKAEAARAQPSYGGPGFGGYVDPNPFFQILPWIVSSVCFILIECLSYKISSWLIPDNGKKRFIVLLYFTINNVVFAVTAGLLVYIFYQIFWY